MNKMRKGFTMIELIFVIVIIGILAAVAIPKLAATRDDAKDAQVLATVQNCIQDVVTAYTATGTEDLTTESCTITTNLLAISVIGNKSLQIIYRLNDGIAVIETHQFKGTGVN